MRNLKFKFAAAYNFLPFGGDGIQLHFDNYKKIVLIRGTNLDSRPAGPAQGGDERSCSNGAGKSSIQEIITYALYGKTVKRPEKLGANDVVHNKVGRDARVELVFDNYRIVRSRKEGGNDKKNSLRLWESADGTWDKTTEITQGTMAATQERIESIIGLSYEAFVNISVFTDDQRACFLECDSKQKKEIVENMLALGAYRGWFDNAKGLRKEIKTSIDTKAKEYTLLLASKEDASKRLTLTKEKERLWKESKRKEIKDLTDERDRLIGTLGKTDNGAAVLAYQKAQEMIKEVNDKLPAKEKEKGDLDSKLDLARKKEAEIKVEAQGVADEYREVSAGSKSLVSQRTAKEEEIRKLKSNEIGATCDKCKGVVSEENIKSYIEELNRDISGINSDIKDKVEQAKKIQEKADVIKSKQDKVKMIADAVTKQIAALETEMKGLRDDLVRASQVREPKVGNEETAIQAKVEEANRKIAEKTSELDKDTPFKDILDNDAETLKAAERNLEDKARETKELEAELPYYDYWIAGFGDNGIRRWVVDGITPELNNRVNYWLQFLIDNKIALRFDNELNETIERNPADGDPYIYHAMSTGQRRRLNLAVSQSFAHIMMMSAGSIPSVVFLDEVSTNVDLSGNLGIYRMILELSQDRQVFVTTHDQSLLQMLDGCDVLDLVHEDGFTTVKKE